MIATYNAMIRENLYLGPGLKKTYPWNWPSGVLTAEIMYTGGKGDEPIFTAATDQLMSFSERGEKEKEQEKEEKKS